MPPLVGCGWMRIATFWGSAGIVAGFWALRVLPSSSMARLGSVSELLEPWRTRTAPALGRACVGAFGLALAASLSIARVGTPLGRIAAVCVFLGAALPFGLLRRASRRREADPRGALASTLVHTQPELGRAALRAFALAARTARREDTGSLALAQLHFGRLLGRAKLEPLVLRAEALAWRWSTLGVVLALAGFGLVAPDPFKMVEGADVLLARRGLAPLPLEWLSDAVFVAEPPPYLGAPAELLELGMPVVYPVGTVITVRARERHRDRALALSDGRREAAFQKDGQGGVVASWVVEADTTLRVVARFGSVAVPDPLRLDVEALADRAPVVKVENAPSTRKLLENPRIAIHWEAADDHALTEVQLVLRAGEREERRTLSKPQGPTDRGGIDLLASDKFIAKSYVPIEITVEAKDDDPIRGPKWGRSPSLLLVPPQLGELEVLRIRALTAARDALTDLLATRVAPELEPSRAWIESQRKQQRAVGEQLTAALKQDFGGVKVPGRVASAARGQFERLEVALEVLAKAPTKPNRDKLLAITENTLLGLDAVLDALGTRDTRATALKLADVATEASLAIKLGREPAERMRSSQRLAAALGVLEGGGRNLYALSDLGRDLGEIVENDLGRINGAMKDSDRHHARLAAEDLAARLRQPDPSFSSSGGGSMGGTESGATGQEGSPSDAAEDATGLEQALEELRREHASEIAGVERALDDALSEDEKQTMRESLRKLAKGAREAVEELPEQGSEPNSARSEAAQARAQGEGMAAALERGELGEAAEDGKRAVEALDRAAKRGGDAPGGTSEHDVQGAARSAADKLRGLVREAEKQLAEVRKKSSEAARSKLEKAAEREKSLAQRTRAIRDKSDSGEAPLPKEMLEKLDQAAREMESAAKEFEARRGGKGLDAQRQAQRLLEMAQPEKEQQDGSRGGESGDGKEMAQDADVPTENKDDTAARFRRRVTEGLGRKAPGHLRDAVRRYTEGLLR